jgi:hypothetical protein
MHQLSVANRGARLGRIAMAAGVVLALGYGAWSLSSGSADEGASASASHPAELRVLAVAGRVFVADAAAHQTAVTALAPLASDGALRTETDGAVTLERHDGLRVELSESTSLAKLAALTEENRVVLSAGSVRCAVPPQPLGTTFEVDTPDTRVVVHGTVFRVTVTDDDPPETLVRVEEGVVSVHHASQEVVLHAGDSWSSHEPALPSQGREVSEEAPEMSAPSKTTSNAARRIQATPSPASKPHPLAPPDEKPGTLAHEAELLSQGLRAERRGDLDAAQAAFERLLREYPD